MMTKDDLVITSKYLDKYMGYLYTATSPKRVGLEYTLLFQDGEPREEHIDYFVEGALHSFNKDRKRI